MNRRGNGRDEPPVEDLIAQLGARERPPDDGELRAMVRAATAKSRPRASASASRSRRTRWAHPVSWIGAAAAVALIVGAGLGFSLGSSVTTTETASARTGGTGFLPAWGWSVVQSGTVDAAGASRAIAANVQLSPEDDGRDLPYATLESLPARGVVIVARFTTRGDPGADFAYPVQTLPLSIAAADAASGPPLPFPRDLAQYRLRAGVGGTNVDAVVYFGAADPQAEQLAAAQQQLNRLVVASERVTIFARPAISNMAPVTVFGSVDSGRAGEEVRIQAKDCGSSFFRVFAATETRDGGGWSTIIFPRIGTTLRAVWKDEASAQVSVQQRVTVFLDKQPRFKGFRVGVAAKRSFWRKKVLIQRRQGTRWATVKSVLLTDSGASSGTATSWTDAKFTLSVPKGTSIRAVLPLSQAKPCYLAGVSRTVRT